VFWLGSGVLATGVVVEASSEEAVSSAALPTRGVLSDVTG